MQRIWSQLTLLLMLCCCHDYLWSQKSRQLIDSLVNVLHTSKEDTNKVKTLNALCWQLRNTGDPVKAKEYSDSAIVLSGQLQFKPGRATAYNMLGLLAMDKSNNQLALEYFNISLKINEETGNKQGAATNISNMGNVYWAQGNYPEALKYYKKALKISEESGNKNGQLSVYNNIGSIYGAQGNYPEALKNFLATLKLALETGNKYAAAVAYKNIGTIYGYEKNREEALKYFREGLKIMEELGNKQGIANAYVALGEVSEGMGNHKEALDYFLKALKLDEESGNKYHAALVYNHLGSVYFSQADYTEALRCHQTSLKIREEIRDKEGMAESNVEVGNVYSKQAAFLSPSDAAVKYNEAIQFLKKGLTLAKEVGYKETEKAAYGILSRTYKAMNDYKNAMEFNSLYYLLKDSMMNNETTRKIGQLRTQFEVEKAVELETAQRERALAERNAKYELELAKEKLNKEKAIEIERLKYAFSLARAKTEQEKYLAEQEYQNQKKLAEENAHHQQVLTEGKAKQDIRDAEARILLENEKAEKKRRTEWFIAGLAGLALISIFVIILIRQRNQKRRELERSDAGHKMAELELQSLRAQLNPHFMFNSLNAIQDLIVHEENDRSHLYLSRFSKLLRMLLDNANKPFVTVKQELELLELYLSLENLRIPDLQFTIKKDPAINTETRMIPNMMLQPYIENAIWHGLSNKKGERKLQIRIQENGNATHFEIEDNGVGRKKAAALKQLFRKGHHSKGMELLSKRFNLLSREYGAAIQTTITDLGDNGDATGTLVRIDVPFSLSEQAKQSVHDTNHNH